MYPPLGCCRIGQDNTMREVSASIHGEGLEGELRYQKPTAGVDCDHESVGTSVARTDRFEIAEAAEDLSVSPEQLSILSIEEKLAHLEDELHRSAEYVLQQCIIWNVIDAA
jgi:hypothetical protein